MANKTVNYPYPKGIVFYAKIYKKESSYMKELEEKLTEIATNTAVMSNELKHVSEHIKRLSEESAVLDKRVRVVEIPVKFTGYIGVPIGILFSVLKLVEFLVEK